MDSQSKAANQAGMQTNGQRRRLGAWLLLVWAAFWLTTVVQPSCSIFAAISGSDQPTLVAHAADPTAHHRESPSLPSHSDTDCPDLSAVNPGLPNAAAIVVTDRLDILAMATSLPLLLKPYDDARPFSALNVPHPPPSGAPLYLRTQRFRV